jgi:hypothetical protein
MNDNPFDDSELNDEKSSSEPAKRGRKPKTNGEAVNQHSNVPTGINVRLSSGFMSGVDYVINDSGEIDWRAMIPSRFLFPNKQRFESRGEDIPESIDGLKDEDLCINLPGIRYLARIRGMQSVRTSVNYIASDYVNASCVIRWVPNSVDPVGFEYEDWANATTVNCNDFAVNFLETIAVNRAFCRAVRNSLGIRVVSEEELSTASKSHSFDNTEETSASQLSPQNMLMREAASVIGAIDFDDFRKYLRTLWSEDKYRNPDAAKWSEFNDIPAKEARILLGIVSSQK